MLPTLAHARIARYWAGVIDMSPDGLPIIDGFAGPDGLMLISGLSGHGFALGPAIGRSAAELILDGRSMLPLEPFRLERFRRRVPVPKKML